MMREHVDARVLAGLRFVDATTGLPVRGPLDVGAEGATLTRNLSGMYVVSWLPSLKAHSDAFLGPPAVPALGSETVKLKVSDPSGAFLPRASTVALPRDPDPAHAAQSDSLFQPVELILYPAPRSQAAHGWSVLRVTVRAQGTGAPLPGALIRVLRTSDSKVLARGISDWREPVDGEAMVAVSGVPVTTWGNGTNGDPVLVHEVDADVEVFFDAQFKPEKGEVPDPDELETKRAGLPTTSTTVKLASGRTLAVTMNVPLT